MTAQNLYCEPPVKSLIDISETFNLTANDIEHRSQSFVNEMALRLGGIRRVCNDVSHQALGIETRKKDDDLAGLSIPYFDIGNPKVIVEYEIRLDRPKLEKTGDGVVKDKQKYLKPRTTKNHLYVPPIIQEEWFTTKNKKIIVITEGAFKALALARAGSHDFTTTKLSFIPIAISGVDNFRTKTIEITEEGEKRIISAGLPEFERIEWQNTVLIICFDSDLDEKPGVKFARLRLSRFFREKKVKVFNLNFPKEFEGIPTKGIDDYLGAIERSRGCQAAIDIMIDLVDKAQKPATHKPLVAENFELIEDGNVPGVYYTSEKGERMWVCSPLEILAETQTESGENYGRLLRWSDSKNRIKTWAMPLEMVHGDSSELVKYLVSRGLNIGASRSHYDKLKNYINLSQPEEAIICTTKIGWHDGVFVFPNETISTANKKLVYQPEYATAHKFETKGTLKEWQENISRYCSGNSRLAFGVSLAFASVLLPLVGMQGGGFHNRGGTSSGKTTISLVSGSVFGGSNDELGYCQSWKATANGLESVAETHNHTLLCLDELAQIDGRQAGDVAYMLANGEGKKRMTKSIVARRSLSWQLLFLSTGEISLADKMNEVGLMIKGGQEIRVLDIPADTCKFGVFDCLHGFLDGQTFADHLRSSSKTYYGTPIREFLKKFVAEPATNSIKAAWQEFHTKFINEILPNKTYPSEVKRAATRFALVAFAGEMASEFQITNWRIGEAISASKMIFQAWYENRAGRGASDAERAVSQIRAFIEAHGTSRFESLNPGDTAAEPEKIINRAGFRKQNENGEIDYLFFTETFRREVCKGFDYKFVCKILDEEGFIRRESAGYQRQLKYQGSKIRLYWINSKILESLEGIEMKQKGQAA